LLVFFFYWAVTAQVFAQTSSSLSVYENPDFGLRLPYPSHWTIEDNPHDPSRGGNIQGFSASLEGAERPIASDTTFSLNYRKLGEFELPANMTLKEFVREMYGPDSPKSVGFIFIDDNLTTIGNNHEAWMIEYSEGEGEGSRYVLDIYTINGGSGYVFKYMAEKQSSSGNYQSVRNLLDTVELIPLTPTPKQPSFLE
jgi:hypothetical protein